MPGLIIPAAVFQFHIGSIKSPHISVQNQRKYYKKKVKNGDFDRQPSIMQKSKGIDDHIQ